MCTDFTVCTPFCALLKKITTAFSRYVEAIENGERWALERVLDTVARQDGFATINRTEISGPDGGPIEGRQAAIQHLQVAPETWGKAIEKIESMGLLSPGDEEAPASETIGLPCLPNSDS